MKQILLLFLFFFITYSCSKNKFSAEDNEPTKQNFEKELNFELNRNFLKYYKKSVKIKWELLAEKPIKKQTSYPEYFVWIKLYENNRLENQGLVKLIVKDKKFHTISFMNDERIKAVPNDAKREFPTEILEKIENK